ncbi:sensor histidine kinase [Streptomyces sp. NPDC001744]|uniref:sensor histidine kinase n=1 Tax=Streptomyces sp. NPDC001744 TaxID=3364606 RepID=UPI0036A30075
MQGGRVWARVDPLVIDVALACVLAALTIVYGLQGYDALYRAKGRPPFELLAIALSLAVNLPLAVRRYAPWGAFAVSHGALVAYTAAGFQPSANLWAPLFLCYAVIRNKPARHAVWAAAATGAAWLMSGLEATLSVELSVGQSVIGVGVIWSWATSNRRLARRNVQLAELTEQLRREQELRAQHAIVEERLRIARELHDVVAHHLSALAVQAGLADFVFASDPAAARKAVVSIGASSREALEEMRGLLGVLRTDSDAGDPDPLYRSSPGLERLDDLVERTRAAGLDVTLTVTGPRRVLPSGVDLCAYRIVQEALTNTVKHAGRGARVSVGLSFEAGRLTGEISDQGGSVPAALPSNGLGLVGMRERVRLYGGTLRAGPGPEGGFEVAFALPLASLDTAGGG